MSTISKPVTPARSFQEGKSYPDARGVIDEGLSISAELKFVFGDSSVTGFRLLHIGMGEQHGLASDATL